jgi:hypothetical protein
VETISTIISILLLLGLISIPILLFVGLKKWNIFKYEFLTYFIIGLILTAGISWTLAWWMDYSNQLLMEYYGYDFKAINETDRFVEVEEENHERVKHLEMGFYGIGWPLRAFFIFTLSFTYTLILYLVGLLIIRMKRKNKEHAPNIG